MRILQIMAEHSKVLEPQQKKRDLHYASDETVGQSKASSKRSAIIDAISKGPAYPLCTQEPDNAELYTQTSTSCTVFNILQEANAKIPTQVLYDPVF